MESKKEKAKVVSRENYKKTLELCVRSRSLEEDIRKNLGGLGYDI
ncbi:MAG: hypothetical protein ACRCTZ_02995 [Sarcina sp.]